MSEFEDATRWDKSIRACAGICMEEMLEEVLVCDDYTDPSCFCDINDGDPFGQRKSVLGCIQTHCHMTEDPDPDLFVSVCSKFHATESTTSEPASTQTLTTSTTVDSASDQTQGADVIETSSSQEPESSGSEGGLPAGAIAGIAIGSVVAVLLLAAFLFRRRIRRRFDSNTVDSREPKAPVISELEAGAAFAAVKPDAKDDPYLPELGDTSSHTRHPSQISELGGTSSHTRYPSQLSELDGTTTVSASSRPVSAYYSSVGGVVTPPEMSRVGSPDTRLGARSPSLRHGARNSEIGG